MMDHRETATSDVCHMILYNLLCFASVPVFIFGRAAKKVAGIHYQNLIMESCYESKNYSSIKAINQYKVSEKCTSEMFKASLLEFKFISLKILQNENFPIPTSSV